MQDTWADYFSGETYGPADDEHERRTEERDAWLNDEADRLEYEAEAKAWDDEDEHAVECDACGIVVDAIDAVTDDCIVRAAASEAWLRRRTGAFDYEARG